MFRFLILGLLRNGAQMHGYGLVKEYRERSGAEVSTGNFYRELQRLVIDGLIRSAAKPPEADARRTPYEITELGISVFDDWFAAQEAAGGAGAEDDISARALFIADLDPAVGGTLLDHLEENLWFSGKTLERARQLAVHRPAEPGRFDVLALLLARRLKRAAADLEFLEEFRSAYAEWLNATRPAAPAALTIARLRAAPRRTPSVAQPDGRRP
jgi:DNA-binding PadR family transcriptional regulator